MIKFFMVLIMISFLSLSNEIKMYYSQNGSVGLISVHKNEIKKVKEKKLMISKTPKEVLDKMGIEYSTINMKRKEPYYKLKYMEFDKNKKTYKSVWEIIYSESFYMAEVEDYEYIYVEYDGNFNEIELNESIAYKQDEMELILLKGIENFYKISGSDKGLYLPVLKNNNERVMLLTFRETSSIKKREYFLNIGKEKLEKSQIFEPKFLSEKYNIVIGERIEAKFINVYIPSEKYVNKFLSYDIKNKEIGYFLESNNFISLKFLLNNEKEVIYLEEDNEGNKLYKLDIFIKKKINIKSSQEFLDEIKNIDEMRNIGEEEIDLLRESKI